VRPIGILGGTFDPIHFGHLRPAEEVLHGLDLEEIRFIPAAHPPHRGAPGAGAEHRLRMVELAVAGRPGLHVDEREIRMGGPSYTVRTLESVRREIGSRGLCLLMGSDAFGELESWHEWWRLPELAHMVVIARPGWPAPCADEDLPQWARPRICRQPGLLARKSAGLVMFQDVSPQDISASRIRALIAQGQCVEGMVPTPVWEYIRQNRLYGYTDRGGTCNGKDRRANS